MKRWNIRQHESITCPCAYWQRLNAWKTLDVKNYLSSVLYCRLTYLLWAENTFITVKIKKNKNSSYLIHKCCPFFFLPSLICKSPCYTHTHSHIHTLKTLSPQPAAGLWGILACTRDWWKLLLEHLFLLIPLKEECALRRYLIWIRETDEAID